MSDSDSHLSQPIACNLTPIELAAQHTELLPGLLSKADTQDTIEEGFRWSFTETDRLLHNVASVIEAERRCCRFLRFRLTLEPDGGPLRLEVTGPAGTPELPSFAPVQRTRIPNREGLAPRTRVRDRQHASANHLLLLHGCSL